MGKARLKGQHTRIFIKDANGDEINVGEISKFSVKDAGELKKSRSLGEAEVTGSKTFEGYELSFEGGKVDWRLAQMLHLQDVNIKSGERSPYFQVETRFNYFNRESDTYCYPEVTIYGYNLDADANDEAMEKFEGFCGKLRTYTSTSPSTKSTESSIGSRITTMIENAINKDSVPSDIGSTGI